MIRTSVALFLIAVASANSVAGNVHEHGVGNIFLATHGNEVQLQLVLPAEDLPQGDIEALLSLSPLNINGENGCEMRPVNIDSARKSLRLANTNADAHSDVMVNYNWRCSTPVSQVAVTLFERYKSLQKINVQIVSPKYQGVKTLSPKNSQLQWP